jgi:hypothetical protein
MPKGIPKKHPCFICGGPGTYRSIKHARKRYLCEKHSNEELAQIKAGYKKTFHKRIPPMETDPLNVMVIGVCLNTNLSFSEKLDRVMSNLKYLKCTN